MYSPYDIPTYLYASTIEFQYRFDEFWSFFETNTYSKVPIIHTGTYASSAVIVMYCQNCRMSGTYNRSIRVFGKKISSFLIRDW